MKRLTLLLVVALSGWAQTATTVTGRFIDAGKNKLNGTCRFAPVGSFNVGGPYRVIGTDVPFPIANGVMTAALIPTDQASPAGQYYNMTCTIDQHTANGKVVPPYVEPKKMLLIPTNATAVDIGTVVITSTPAQTVTIQPVQIAAAGTPNGTYCLSVVNGAVAGLVACSGSTGGGTAYSTLSGVPWIQLNGVQWSQLNGTTWY